MERKQVENIYIANGLKDFQLRSTDDLLRVHGIDYAAVEGYKRLDDINRRIYEKFIVNIYNAFGLEYRTKLVPKSIYYVEDTQYITKDPDFEGMMGVGCCIKAIDKNGLKTILVDRVDECYKGLDIKEGITEKYLRFDYEENARPEWLHVISETQWY